MNTMRRQAKIMRRKVLLSALEEARPYVEAWAFTKDRDLLLAKLTQEIDRLRIKIKKLEAKP